MALLGIEFGELFEMSKGKVFSLILTALGVVTIYDPIKVFFDNLFHEILKLTDFGRFMLGIGLIIVGVVWNLWKGKTKK